MRNQKALCEMYYERFLHGREKVIRETGRRMSHEIRQNGQRLMKLLNQMRQMIEAIARQIARRIDKNL